MSNIYDKPTVLSNPPVVQPITASDPRALPTPSISVPAPAFDSTHAYAVPKTVVNSNTPAFDPKHAYSKPR